jgi:hypothetical protein
MSYKISANKSLTPIVKWSGGKKDELKNILPHIPQDFNTYLEPFIEELYKDYIVDEYDKKYRFKLHSGRIGDEINTKHLIIKNY